MAQLATATPRQFTPNLRQGEHVCLIGETGSGKTTLAEAFLSRQEWVLVLDTKGMMRWRAFQQTASLQTVWNRSIRRIIYRPESPQEAAKALEVAYRMGGWTVFVDEVYDLIDKLGQPYPGPFIRCLTRGRSRGISVWSGMQRPRGAPWQCFTESKHFFLFGLAHAEDRKHVSQFTIPAIATFEPAWHHFGYYSRFTRSLVASKPLRKEVR